MEDAEQVSQQARRLESLLSGKLAAYAKLSATRETTVEHLERLDSSAKEVEALLSQLTQTVGRMPDSNSYSLTRYQSVLNDFEQEYRRLTKGATRDARLELLSGTTLSDGGLRPRTEPLLREQKGLHRSISETDQVITIAQQASSALKQQKMTLSNAMDKLGNLTTKFPQINSVLQSIRRHRQRDMIVLACVISGCMCFMFLYVVVRH